jgi:hypothetical protein
MTEVYQSVYPNEDGIPVRILAPWVLDPLEFPRPEEREPQECDYAESLRGIAEGTNAIELGS